MPEWKIYSKGSPIGAWYMGKIIAPTLEEGIKKLRKQGFKNFKLRKE